MSELDDDYSVIDDSEKIEDVICYGLGCFNYAAEEMTLKAGTFGIIDVFLCSKCTEIIKRKEEIFGEKASLADTLSPNSTSRQHSINR